MCVTFLHAIFGDIHRLPEPVQCSQQQHTVVNPLVLPDFVIGQPPTQAGSSACSFATAAAGADPAATVQVIIREPVSMSGEEIEAAGPSKGQIEPFWSLQQPASRQQQCAAAAAVPAARQAWGSTDGAAAAACLSGLAGGSGSSSSSPQPPELQLQGLSLQESSSAADLAAAGNGGPTTPVLHEPAEDANATPPSSDRSHHMQQALPALQKSITEMVGCRKGSAACSGYATVYSDIVLIRCSTRHKHSAEAEPIHVLLQDARCICCATSSPPPAAATHRA